MLIIGLTGGIGSGKTTVCNYFSALGAPVIDADLVAREVVKPGQPGLTPIITRFGQDILAADGSLNRAKLRELIFSDKMARQELEGILHPLIRARMDEQLATVKSPYAIVSIPLLLENGQTENIDRILVIDADESQQILRTCQRDDQNHEQIQAILDAQCNRKDRLVAADDIIYNTGDLDSLKSQVAKMHNYYLNLDTIDQPDHL
ncbi:Dephospho-CoA kinase [hydrothermal vent metagenome]|uniref:Dephospho-CoA kinase n=1 Tax=hydrothermal vent metagenome TaxID=652676 RepID=A0A3B1B9U9_9ZZZZ